MSGLERLPLAASQPETRRTAFRRSGSERGKVGGKRTVRSWQSYPVSIQTISAAKTMRHTATNCLGFRFRPPTRSYHRLPYPNGSKAMPRITLTLAEPRPLRGKLSEPMNVRKWDVCRHSGFPTKEPVLGKRAGGVCWHIAAGTAFPKSVPDWLFPI